MTETTDSDATSVYSDLDDDQGLENGSDGASTDDNESDADEPSTSGGAVDRCDSSDEEDLRNTIGNIPISWYDSYDHIGYNLSGLPITKGKKQDEIEQFLAKMEDPNFWRKVRDKQTGSEITLTDEHVSVIENLRKSRYPVVGYNPYQPFLDFFTNEVMKHPIINPPDHKRSFIPSKLEKEKVSRMVHAIKMGWMKPRKPKADGEADEADLKRYYDLWIDSGQDNLSKSQLDRLKMHIPPPKMKLPGHEESYNPPSEYLFDNKEEKAWKEQEPEERKLDIMPQKFDSMRQVPAYADFINERFHRCLDLYLAPRQRKMRLNVDPEDLLPKLPKPEDLQPFPTTQAIIYKGHEGIVRSVDVEPTGQFIVSGSDDGSLKIWEISTGRCKQTIKLGGTCQHVACSPSKTTVLIACAVDNYVYLIVPKTGSAFIISDTEVLIESLKQQTGGSASQSSGKEGSAPIVTWDWCDSSMQKQGCRFRLTHSKPVKHVSWHKKADYFATVTADGGSNSVVVHQLSKCKSQIPFARSRGIIQRVLFHPTQPLFYVASQRYIRVYNLVKQQLVKKLIANCQYISSMALHPTGDHVIVGSYDCRVVWFDCDLSVKPYQTLRFHKQAVRSVAFHSHYPLFASGSDDGSTIVCHGKAYSDFQNPLIVPVKILRGHAKKLSLGVTACVFHPLRPWIFTAGADGTIRLFI